MTTITVQVDTNKTPRLEKMLKLLSFVEDVDIKNNKTARCYCLCYCTSNEWQTFNQ